MIPMEEKMRTAIVTGAAGFIGSHLAERLLAEGYQVLGVDCFTSYYPRPLKEANLALLRRRPGFRFIEANLVDTDCRALLQGVDYVFHQAAQAGVRTSWGQGFGDYVQNNIVATQRLLEAAKGTAIKALVFASSSSIYGNAETFPTPEDVAPRPVSPYGITKLSCEHLCRLYYESFAVPVVTLRYFTAYGPRQRIDMAMHRFISAMLEGREIVIYGDGSQTRDFTYVSDIVAANLLALAPEARGQVFNIGGGSRISLSGVVGILEDALQTRARLSYVAQQQGDARDTAADISRARSVLGYAPAVTIEEGLRKEAEWLQKQAAAPVPLTIH